MSVIYLATANPKKVKEFEALAASRLPQCEFRIAGPLMPPVEENAPDFAGNARLKARALLPLVPKGSWVIADDSGLCVDALGGAPGVYSARFSGPGANDARNNAFLLEKLQNVPAERRTARFICVLALLDPEGREQFFQGECSGTVLMQPSGSQGFGYDTVFAPEGYAESFNELGPVVKHAISHRARALQSLADWLAVHQAASITDSLPVP